MKSWYTIQYNTMPDFEWPINAAAVLLMVPVKPRAPDQDELDQQPDLGNRNATGGGAAWSEPLFYVVLWGGI